MNKDYQTYLKSDAWRYKKREVFLERGRTCEKCMSKKDIQVHHLRYDNIFNEPLEDLQILCSRCHEKEHGIKRKKKKRYKWSKNRTTRTSDKINNPKQDEPKRYSTREEIQKRINSINK